MSEGDDLVDEEITLVEDSASEPNPSDADNGAVEVTQAQTDNPPLNDEKGHADVAIENNNDDDNPATDDAIEPTETPSGEDEAKSSDSNAIKQEDTDSEDSTTQAPSESGLENTSPTIKEDMTPSEPEISLEQPLSTEEATSQTATEEENSDGDQKDLHETDIMWELDPAPQTPQMGELDTTPITTVHSLGDLHGWAPGLISYLIENKLASISIGGAQMQNDDGTLHIENLNSTFPNPTLNWPSIPKSGLQGQPNMQWYGVQNKGHAAINARWIASPEVAFVQVGDIFDRADHSELAAEILRQLIIDAPGRVFALVGNHEQFMLENDYQNWAHNEVRSAHTDYDVGPKKGQRAHFRFINPAKDQHEVMQEVFERYTNSVWTLFLTQGAVMNKLGWVDGVVSEISSLETMLEQGWAPYEHADKIRSTLSTKGKEIPGAISALTINDILFHHAEPAAHQTNHQGSHIALYKTISVHEHPGLHQFKLQMYRHGGGSLHDSEDQTLLWARGSSSGANSGQPSAEKHLEKLAANWPGLHRIVHGHTPTVGLSEFSDITSGESRPVSYNADKTQTQPVKGRANRIRVHNIDEGMSPVYFQHAIQSPYDPCRAPIGLRMELEGNDMPEASSESSDLVSVPPLGSMDEDRRKLWLWQPSEWKTNLPTEPQLVNGTAMSAVNFNDWKGVILIGNSPNENELLAALNRKINGRKVSSFLVERCMNKLLSKKGDTLPRQITYIPIIGDDLDKGKTLSILRKNNISIVATKVKNGVMEIIVCNGFEDKLTFELTTAQSLESKSTVRPLETKPFTATQTALSDTVVAVLSPENIGKSSFRYLSSQEGQSVDSVGSFGYYFATASESKTPTLKTNDLAVMPPPQPKVEMRPSEIKQDERQQSESAQKGGLKRQTTDEKQKRNTFGVIRTRRDIQQPHITETGLQGQVSDSQKPKKSDVDKGIHRQSGADKGKEATSSKEHGITSQVTSPNKTQTHTDSEHTKERGNRLDNFNFSLHSLKRSIEEDIIDEIDSFLQSNSEEIRINMSHTVRHKHGSQGFVFLIKVIRAKTNWKRFVIKCEKFENYTQQKNLEKTEPSRVIAEYDSSGALQNKGSLDLIPKLVLKEASEILDQLSNKVVQLFSLKGGD